MLFIITSSLLFPPPPLPTPSPPLPPPHPLLPGGLLSDPSDQGYRVNPAPSGFGMQKLTACPLPIAHPQPPPPSLTQDYLYDIGPHAGGHGVNHGSTRHFYTTTLPPPPPTSTFHFDEAEIFMENNFFSSRCLICSLWGFLRC